MRDYFNHTNIGTCANCDKNKHGLYSDTRWGHNHKCCGEDCGKLLAQRLQAASHNRRVIEIENQITRLQEEQRRVWTEAFNASGAEF